MYQAQDNPADREYEAGGTGSVAFKADIVVERSQSGQPHKGKMLAAIQPHCDDIPIFAGGTIAKLLSEGYQGILITLQRFDGGHWYVNRRHRIEERARHCSNGGPSGIA
jgi:hypothetical protein